jgi:hypothetical protein
MSALGQSTRPFNRRLLPLCPVSDRNCAASSNRGASNGAHILGTLDEPSTTSGANPFLI